MNVAILTVSDLGAAGAREDTSGAAIRDWCPAAVTLLRVTRR